MTPAIATMTTITTMIADSTTSLTTSDTATSTTNVIITANDEDDTTLSNTGSMTSTTDESSLTDATTTISPTDDATAAATKTTTTAGAAAVIVAGRNDFYWKYDDEPHASRRQLILAKYPQVKELYGYDPYMKYQVLSVVVLQTYIALYVAPYLSSWWMYGLLVYVVGGTCNHMMFMALHELSHNLGFSYIPYNKYFASYVANLPIGIPAAVSFKRYHLDHHRYQGVDVIDVDIPSVLEGRYIHGTLRKFLFVIFQLVFYAIRPMFVNPKPVTVPEIYNAIAVLSYDALLFYLAGGSLSPLYYLVLSTFVGGGLHPCAGHFIAEHYIIPSANSNKNLKKDDDHIYETYSYYGILNYLTFHVGYHNEHHDFPYIPGRRLAQLRNIAKEFYNDRPYYQSWCYVIYRYIVDPTVTGFSRVKRPTTSAWEHKNQ